MPGADGLGYTGADSDTKKVSANLFQPLTQRGIVFRNRIAVSPMCQYSSRDGFAHDWHLVHLGSRAAGGAGLVMMEATAVEARGRITHFDQGLWRDEQVEFLTRIAAFVKGQGAVAGIQLGHAGRKAGVHRPWEGGAALTAEEGAWEAVAPSAIPFRDEDPPPAELSRNEIQQVIGCFIEAACRALRAGFQVLELHGAHGYLIHQFLSPLSNLRQDEYGGSFANRARFALETIEAVRAVWPRDLPLWLRISATDWVEGGWTVDDSVALARLVKAAGVDLIDCSSGGASPRQKIPLGPCYQVPFAERIRAEAGIATGAVGLITTPQQAEEIVASGKADVVLLAREFLRDPYFPLHAAQALGVKPEPPVQYARAF